MDVRPTQPSSQSSFIKALTHDIGSDLIWFGLLAVGCLIFTAASIALQYDVSSTAKSVSEELAGLPYAVGQPAGTRAVLTGTIAEGSDPLLKNFVAYVEEDYNAGGKYETRGWEFVSGKTRTFRVNTPYGSMDLASPSYDLSPRVPDTNQALLPDWDHVEARVEEPPGTFDRARRYRGLVAGGPVTAIGTVTPEGAFEADFVVGADLKEVEAQIAPVASGETSSFANFLTMIGLAGLAVTIALFIRARLRHAREVTAG